MQRGVERLGRCADGPLGGGRDGGTRKALARLDIPSLQRCNLGNGALRICFQKLKADAAGQSLCKASFLPFLPNLHAVEMIPR